MYVLGIDQAIRSTGLTLMDTEGNMVAQRVIHIPAKDKILDDIGIILKVTEGIRNFVQDQPVLVACIELPTFSSASQRSKQLNMLFGSILQGLGIPYLIGNATAVKKFATGSGRHSKEEKKVVMQRAWENQDKDSYDLAFNTLSEKYTKSVVTRAIGDLADSFWLAKYGIHRLEQINPDIELAIKELTKDSNPNTVVTDLVNTC